MVILTYTDDEHIPDPAILPVFSDRELGIANNTYQRLTRAFVSAEHHHFTNAAGKMFFQCLGEFVLLMQPTECYVAHHSNNPHGDCQPGSVVVAHTHPATLTRQHQATNQCTCSVERVADFVIFDHHTQMYTIVGAIKSDDAALVEHQNMELGLWRKHQSAMLGFTCNPQGIHPKVLLRSETFLIMYHLPCLSHASKPPLIQLTEFFIAFTSFVNTVV